jgi:hypothetical protein
MMTHDELVAKMLENPKVKAEYDALEIMEALEDAYWGERALAAEKNGEFVDGLPALAEIARQKGVTLDAPIT